MSEVAIQSDSVYIDGAGRSVKWASIDAATAATHEIVAAVAGKKIRVTAVTLVCAGDVTVTWKSATTALCGAMSFASKGGFDTNRTPPNYFLETVAGEALQLTLSAGVQVSGTLNYVEV